MADSFLRQLRRSMTNGIPGFLMQPGVQFGGQGALISGAAVVVAPAAAVTPDLSAGGFIRMTFAANTAVAFAIPTNVPTGLGAIFSIQIINTSGGALTLITYAAAYKNAALTYPATANNRTFTWFTDGVNAWELYQTAADVAN